MFQIEKRTLAQQLLQLSLTAGLALVLTASMSASATAAGGSWGGSGGFGSGGGSWGGSGGSFGASGGSTGSGRGLFGGRRPIRDFFGRIGARLSSGSGGSNGSGGGLFARSRGGSTGGSTGGSWGGSTGGYSAASYDSWGSAATGPSLASFDSMPSYDFGSFATVAPSIYAAPSYSDASYAGLSNFGTPNFVDTTSFTSPGIAGCANCAMGSEVPFDQGVSTGLIETDYSSDTGTYDGSMPNYGGSAPIDGSIPLDGMPIDGSFDPGSAAPTDYYDSGSSLLDDGTSPVPPLPGPTSDNSATRSFKPRSSAAAQQPKTAAILTVSLPADAKVYINGKRTKTEGAVRNYVSRRLKSGQNYPYQVKAVINRDGKRLVRTGTVAMTAGVTRTLKLDFDQPATTILAVEVPKDATVRLCGADTAAKGERRFFETDKLPDGETWKGYEIEVTVKRDGKDVVIRQSLTLNSGETREVAFDFNDKTGQLVASK